jgi:hypothetical protein
MKSILKTNKKGDKSWRNESGFLHRLDGPAIERSNGCKEWWVNGLRHRLDDPAIEGMDGYKEWYEEGKLHRLDGPAIEYPNGDCEWYINGHHYTKEEFEEYIKWNLNK